MTERDPHAGYIGGKLDPANAANKAGDQFFYYGEWRDRALRAEALIEGWKAEALRESNEKNAALAKLKRIEGMCDLAEDQEHTGTVFASAIRAVLEDKP